MPSALSMYLLSQNIPSATRLSIFTSIVFVLLVLLY
jgi:hypothetical protein